MAEPELRHLHRERFAIELNGLVAPVELVGLARGKHQRDEHLRGASRAPCRIASRKMLPGGIVASPEMLPVGADATMMPLTSREAS